MSLILPSFTDDSISDDYSKFLKQIYLRHSSNVKLGLERMYEILGKMGNPEKKLKGIHIAGTNGKGSTSAISESLLIHHGHKTGLNTSPHLIDYTERFRVNGKNITPKELMLLYEKYYDCFEASEASFFEITTALAFSYFLDQQVDSSVIEVGLGGRLDGTNPFKANVSVITSISMDHPKSLGDTIEQIAFEKAGIIKEDTPVVIGAMPYEASEIIKLQAKTKNAPCYEIFKDFFVENISLTKNGTCFDYSFPKYDISFKNLKLNLLGYHQANNAALAITAFILYFRDKLWTGHAQSVQNIVIPEKVYQSLEKVNWQGRLQILSSDPLVVIDGAHNEEGVSALIKNIKQIFPDKKYHFLVAILRDKKLDNMIKEICTIAEDIYISKNQSDRAADIQEQVDVAIACGTKYYAFDDIITSAQKCLANMKTEQDMMIITGSLYTIAEILRIKDELF